MPKTLRAESIENVIYTLRGVRVMLDSDLAAYYGVETKRLLEQVRRNAHRFPKDFSYQLDAEEYETLRSQIATSNTASKGRGGRRFLPWVFTEHGAVMLASVLNSKTAIDASVAIVRAFVQLQKAARISGGELIAKLAQIDGRLTEHDETFTKVIDALDSLLNPPAKPGKEVGFHTLMEETGVTNSPKYTRRNIRYSGAPKRARKEKKA
ncbi:MAG: hypothetical protein RL088_877 [Verrucomicrobiota bacterium]|jgi:hypothetical protein